MNDEYIKVQHIESQDVEMTRRGFMDVKIKKEYDGKTYEYDTTFVSNHAANSFAGIEEGDNKNDS